MTKMKESQQGKVKFLESNENRLLVTLLLAAGYPIVCVAFFPVIIFLILPAAGLMSHMLPYLYWLASAGNWVILSALVLPLMRKDIPDACVGDAGEIGETGGTKRRETFSMIEDGDARDRRFSESEKAEKETPEKGVEGEEELKKEFILKQESKATVHRSSLELPDEEKNNSFLSTKKQEKDLSNERLSLRLKEGESDLEEDDATEVTRMLTTSETISKGGKCTTETVVTKSVSHRVDVRETPVREGETYECSLPSPSCVGEDRRASKNAVFLFLNHGDDVEGGERK